MRALVIALSITACRSPGALVDAGATIEITTSTATAKSPMPTTPSLPVPADWPADVPIVPGVHVSKVNTSVRKGDAGVVRTVEFETPKELADVISFYRAAFARAKKLNDVNISMAYVMQFVQADETIDIMMMNAMGLTQVSVTVTGSR